MKCKQHGGARPGAGRKRTGVKRGGAHRRRPSLSHKHPVHVVLRTVRGVPRLRQACMYEAIRRVLLRYLARREFRVVHISLQHNHIHLLVEAAGSHELTYGMQSFAISAARAINRAWGREGKVFAFRYHASQIKDARYARNAIAYVLNNWRRHREDFHDAQTRRAMLDAFSSAVTFDGWTIRFGRPPPDYEPLPVSPAETRLLREEWKLFDRIDPEELPGPMSVWS
jgi:REP element-mobilizing transposase RayT